MHYVASETPTGSPAQTTTTPPRLRIALTLAVVVAVCLGLYFRFIRLDAKHFWYDEVLSASCVSGRAPDDINALFDGKPRPIGDLQSYLHLRSGESYATTIDTVSRNPENAPLYFLLLRLWAEAFGDSAAMLRCFSAFLAIVGGGLLVLLCREFRFGRTVEACAICWWSISPFFVLYSQEARTYSLFAVMALSCNLTLLRAMRLQTWRSWAAYASVAALGFYTHMFIATLLVAHALYVAAIGCFYSSPDERRRLFTRFTVAGACAVAAFVPWIVILLRFDRKEELTTILNQPVRFNFLLQAWIESIAVPFVDFGLRGSYLARGCNTAIAVAMFGGLGWSMRYVWRRAPRHTSLFLLTTGCLPPLMFIGFDLLFGGKKSEVVRFWLPALISLGLIFSYAIGMKCAAGSRRAIIAGLVVLVAAAGSCYRSSVAPTWWNKVGYVSRLHFAFCEQEQMRAGLAKVAATPNALLVVEEHKGIEYQLVVMSAIADAGVEWAGVSDPAGFQPPPDREVFLYWCPKLTERFFTNDPDPGAIEAVGQFARLPRTSLR